MEMWLEIKPMEMGLLILFKKGECWVSSSNFHISNAHVSHKNAFFYYVDLIKMYFFIMFL